MQEIVSIFTEWIWPVFLFIFGLGAVVFVHELGHFLVAKAVGIKVERFAIGFGPRVCGYRGKETDYSIMLLPLGGYVKMLGQEDVAPLKEDEEPDPRSYTSKSVGARFAVISAGVIMNVIFAAIMFVIIGMIGKPENAPVIGGTVPNLPAGEAVITWLDASGEPIDAKSSDYPSEQSKNLMPGDRIKTIDGDGLMLKILGRDITKFEQVVMQAALSDITDKYTLGIERVVGDKVLKGKVVIGLAMAPSPGGTGGNIPAFGIKPAPSTIIDRWGDYVEATNESFKKDDKIVSVNGRAIKHNWDITAIEKTLGGRSVKITVERNVDGQVKQVELPTFQPTITNTNIFFLKDGTTVLGNGASLDDKTKKITVMTGPGKDKTKREIPIADLVNTSYSSKTGLTKEFLDILGMIPRVKISAVAEGSPADKAKLQAGDVIVSYGNHSAPTHLQLRELNNKFAADGANIVVLRDGKLQPPVKIKPKQEEGKQAVLGVIVTLDQEHLVVGGVRENSTAAKLEITSTDVIEKVNDTDVKTWADLLTALSELKDKEVTLTIRRGTNSTPKTIDELSQKIFDKSNYTATLLEKPWGYTTLRDPSSPRGAVAALAWGGRETMFFITTSYATLRSLVMKTVSPKDLAGPVGIGNLAIRAGRRSMLDFAYFMAMISVSLAVINFLPFPVVDGGHAMFLIIEKIRGRPLPVSVMNVIQYIGLAMILFVFVFVTWQDISKLLR
ncbi:MAG: PDZ domain-containing protein [Phycisphaerales bacterium]|nr:PDZ domain-containing protein [Phycisphaerales bacterium]